MVIRNAVLRSRKAGLWTAAGIALGNLGHTTYCVIGLAALIQQSPLLFSALKYAGAAYLAYVGIKAIRSPGYENQRIIGDQDDDQNQAPPADIPASKAFRQGLVTNLLNPKATIFYLSLFPQFADGLGFAQTALLGLVAPIVAILWFSAVAVMLSARPMRRRFLAHAQWIDRICGGLFLLLGARLALE